MTPASCIPGRSPRSHSVGRMASMKLNSPAASISWWRPWRESCSVKASRMCPLCTTSRGRIAPEQRRVLRGRSVDARLAVGWTNAQHPLPAERRWRFVEMGAGAARRSLRPPGDPWMRHPERPQDRHHAGPDEHELIPARARRGPAPRTARTAHGAQPRSARPYQTVRLNWRTSLLSSAALTESDLALVAISWVEAEVCSVDADTSSVDADDASATAATSSM